MKRERDMKHLLFVFFAAAAIVLTSCAHEEMAAQAPVQAGVIAKTGSSILLFHGGTVEAKKVFCPGEVITAYRYTNPYRYRPPYTATGAATEPIGKVQLGKYIGEHYIDAKVIEGNVKTGDIVEKGSAACLVMPAPR